VESRTVRQNYVIGRQKPKHSVELRNGAVKAATIVLPASVCIMPPPASAFNTFPPDTHDAMGKPKPLDRVHAVARLRHLSLGTERAYSDWIRRSILFYKKPHPEEMGAEEIRQFPGTAVPSTG
jgi:hypothetical protein